MPLYEYQCEKCGHQFELIRKFSDPPLEVCPKCGGKVRKLMSSPAIQFKGTGWYITDYAKKDQVAPTKSGEHKSGESTAGVSKSDATSDAKSDKKSDTKKADAKADTKKETKSETKSST
jgi:putative FmdB family regulatory protein